MITVHLTSLIAHACSLLPNVLPACGCRQKKARAEEDENSGGSEDDAFYDRTAGRGSKGQTAKPGASKAGKAAAAAAQPVEDAASLYGKKVRYSCCRCALATRTGKHGEVG